ncbi:TPA: hypothetical protein JIS17_12480 [Acinetobacter baumannii]|nr:hypothetical protein [Acinetobacter baumannii]HAV4579107.1 hypothetical protein [Acinetobacter baumannii]
MAQLAPMMQLRPRFEDKCGHPLAGGNVFAFEAGTSNPKATYADAEGTIPNTHPIKLDYRGEADIFLLSGRYRFVVYSCTGVEIYDVDDVGEWLGVITADRVIDGDKTQKQINEEQKQINNGLETIEQLKNLEPIFDKTRIFVKNFTLPNLALIKPYFGGGGGNFVFEKDSVELTDNVYIFEGIGGKWKRVNWIKPSIYDAGIYDESLDNTDKFKALLSATATIFKGKKEIDLDGKTLKVTDFTMYSNMLIKNGGLDFTGSTVINTSNFAFAGLIVGENAAYRDLDPQVHSRYADLPVISNFGFDNVEFTSPAATNNIRRNIMAFYKWKGFKMLRCKFNLSGARAYKLVGSFNNTDYTGLGLWDQPQPFGGYSSKAKIKFNEFIGTGYSQNTGGANIMSDTGQFAAVEDIEFAFNSSKNLMIGCHFDAYTRNSSCHHNNYEITDDMITAFNNASVPDVIGVYVGQCGYGNSIYKNKVKNAIRHSIYVEAGSDVDIRSNKINHSSALIATNPTVAHGITVQANLISDATSGTSFSKGCEDIEISGNTIRGLRQGIVVSSTIADSARAVNVHDNDVKVSGNLAAIYTTNIMDSNIHDNKCVGGIWLGRMLDCVVKDNKARNSSNYALYLTAGLKTGTVVEGNDLSCDSGEVIYNGTTSGEVLNIHGGSIQQTAGTASIKNGSGVGVVRCYGFDNKVARKQFTHTEALSLAAGATKLVTVPHTGIKNGWFAEASLDAMSTLYTENGINLTIEASAKLNAVGLLVTNKGSATVSFTPTYSISLESYADNTYTN